MQSAPPAYERDMASAGTPHGWVQYASRALGIRLSVPPAWRAVDDGLALRGDGGAFVAVHAVRTQIGLEEAAQYGALEPVEQADPGRQIEALTVDGQPARLVWPDDASVAPFVLIELPRPLLCEGQRTALVAIRADDAHIVEITQTVRFSEPNCDDAQLIAVPRALARTTFAGRAARAYARTATADVGDHRRRYVQP